MNDNVNDDNKYRERLALALDCDDLVEAVRLARELKPWFELHTRKSRGGGECNVS